MNCDDCKSIKTEIGVFFDFLTRNYSHQFEIKMKYEEMFGKYFINQISQELEDNHSGLSEDLENIHTESQGNSGQNEEYVCSILDDVGDEIINKRKSKEEVFKEIEAKILANKLDQDVFDYENFKPKSTTKIECMTSIKTSRLVNTNIF